MAATQGSVPGIPSTNNSNYVTVTDEPKLDSISFRESLRFFQEQLILNSKELSPSLTRILNSDINISFTEDTAKNEKHSESIQSREYEDAQDSENKSKISIPTVETILESVRVLRAIQKSQEQRGSKWTLNMSQPEYHLKSTDRLFSHDDETGISPDDIDNETGSNTTLVNDVSIDNASLNEQFYDPVKNYDFPKEEITEIFWPQNSISDLTDQNTNIRIHHLISTESDTNVLKHEFDGKNYLPTEERFETLDSCADALVSSTHKSSPEKGILRHNTRQNNESNTNNDISNVNRFRNEDGSEGDELQEAARFQNADVSGSNCITRSNTHDTPPVHLRPDSRSDTCSSHYVSAECSPCHSLHYDFELHSQTDDEITSDSSPFVNCNRKKEKNFETWTTDSSGVCTVTTHDAEVRESTSSLSSNSIDTNILDDCQTPDKLSEELTESASNTVSKDNEKMSSTDSILTESANTNNSDDESYHSFTLPELNSLSPSPILKETFDTTALTLPQQSELEKRKELSLSTSEMKKISNLLGSESSEYLTGETASKKLDSYELNDVCLTTNDTSTSNVRKENLECPKDLPSNPTTQAPENNSNNSSIEKKITSTAWNLEAIIESLYPVPQPALPEILKKEPQFESEVYIESKGAFCNYPEGIYKLTLQHQSLWITKERDVLFTMPLVHPDVCINGNALQVDNKLGRCLYLKLDTECEAESLKEEIEQVSSKDTVADCINLVHYPLKSHRNVIIIDLGSCSTRAGILMDQPTLPFIFFPSVCATDKSTGKHVYGNDALQQDIRKNSTLSFPLRSSIKIIKHNIEVGLLEGLFKKIFQDLRVDPKQFTVQVCLPRTLSINTQNDLVRLLLENLQVPSVSLTHQALLTLYAHNVGTGIVVDIGDRMEIVPVVDGFIVENGVTRLPYGGQRLIHHMKHALAEKHISLSNEIESFVVQYISEKLSYVAADYESESEIAIKYPESLRKSVMLETFARDKNCVQVATLDEARFKIPEGLFKPDLWGLDNSGVHQLVQKAIQAASVDVRKKIAENIYISGGVTMIPGFVERLTKELTNLNTPRINPKVIASNYRYHCTYIGACEFARMEVFQNVCLTHEEYCKSHTSSLKKFVLCF